MVKTNGSRAEVWHGTADHTTGGLKKGDLMKNKHGRIISKKKHAAGKKALKFLHAAGYIAKKGTFGTKKSSSTKKKTKSLTKAMFNKLDTNKDNVIDYAEFVKGLKSQKQRGGATGTCDNCGAYGAVTTVSCNTKDYKGRYDLCGSCDCSSLGGE